MRAFPVRSPGTAASAETRLAEIEVKKRDLKRTIQDCQERIEDLDAEKDELYLQLRTEAHRTSNGSSHHQHSSPASSDVSSNGNGLQKLSQNNLHGPPGFSAVSPALQHRLGSKQDVLLPPECTGALPAGLPIPPSHTGCPQHVSLHSTSFASHFNSTVLSGLGSFDSDKASPPSSMPLPTPVIQFGQQEFGLNASDPAASAASSISDVKHDRQDLESNSHSTLLYQQLLSFHLNKHKNAHLQQPYHVTMTECNTIQNQQPDIMLQALSNGNMSNPEPLSAQHTPVNAQSTGRQSNGKPSTPPGGVFARLGVPTTRPTPQGPDSRGRPQATPSPNPSSSPLVIADEHPPGFASPMRLPSYTLAAQPSSAGVDPPGRGPTPVTERQICPDRMQSSQPRASEAPHRPTPHPQTNMSDNGSSGANEEPDDLPPGFARPSSQASQARGPSRYSNGLDQAGEQAQPGVMADEAVHGSSSATEASQAGLSWAEEAAAADDDGGEFPGLSFGIRGLDQRKKLTPPDTQQDFPSLGGGGGPDRGPKPGGAWGKGSGALKLQPDQVAASLVAASQTPQQQSSPAVHVEHLELSAGLRVAGDDVSDSVRKRRAKKHEFEKWENVRGMGNVNIVQGLELFENVLSPDEQAQMIAVVQDWVVQGHQGQLRGRTFSAPRKWAKGKGRITCQFGCCYNYAIDREGRKPGIVAEEVVEKMPPVLLSLCKRLVRWGILPKTKEPDTAIVNVYDSEDCIPPHIDHHDFDRPFCTISLLSEESIMFGTKIISRGPGDFACDYQIPLPKDAKQILLTTGSCLVLKGNGADVAQHCVPPVASRRISITLRRMADVHARRVLAMAQRVHAGLPVEDVDTSTAPKRISADDAYDIDERQQAQQRPGRRYN